MLVEIVAPTGPLWHGEATQVRVPAADGEMGILAGHTPVMALMVAGKVHVSRAQGEDVSFDVTGGFITVDEDRVYVLVDSDMLSDR